jgi:hypothetical protein
LDDAHEAPGLFSAASPNQVFYNTKVDGEDNRPQVIKINAQLGD